MRPCLLMKLICLAAVFGFSQAARSASLPKAFSDGGQCVPRFDAAKEFAYGIDISKWQGDIDWKQVTAKTGILYTFIRASEGLETDSKFQQNWENSTNGCILRAPYHFFLEQVDPVEQAKKLAERLSAIGADQSELPVTADIERGSDTVQICNDANHAKTFLGLVYKFVTTFENQTNRRMMIYTSTNFWNCLGDAKHLANGRHIWIAEYTKNPAPKLPADWRMWRFWQFYSKGRVAGIDADVDADRFNGSGAGLLKFASENK